MKFGEYLVTGSRRYRGHAPGSRFIARLEPRVEARAISLGVIHLIRRVETRIDPGKLTFPEGWLRQSVSNESRESGSSHSRR